MTKKNIELIILISALIIFFTTFITLTILKSNKEKEVLKNEIISFSNKDLINDDFYITIKTQGDYAYIEQTAKKYYKDLSDSIKTINQYINNEEFANILTIQNIEKDKPNYKKSHNIINNIKINVNNAINKITYLCDQETINNLIDKNKINEDNYNLFLTIMYQNYNIKELDETKIAMQNLANSFNTMLNKIDEILYFFETNSSSWIKNNNNIYFENEQLANQYNNLYKELDTIISKFNYYDYNSTNYNQYSQQL